MTKAIAKRGRPPGSKNKATLIKQEVQDLGVQMFAQKAGQVFQDILDQATAVRDASGNIIEKGDPQSQKLVHEVFMKGGALGTEDTSKPKKTFRIEIVSLEEQMGIVEDAEVIDV